ncbi:MAG: zinc-ribbon domain-containing protein [Desulfobacterales bacterium]|nr:zinc-ribbon domain-containing protein [Desulfobacterales bacterium]
MPKATPNYNLFELKPNLVKEWHPTKNGTLKPSDVTPGSGKKVWWICEAGHEWQAVIYSRSRGSGCRFCNRHTKADNNRLALSLQGLIKEWHPTKNGKLNPREAISLNSENIWWICEKSHEWKAMVKNRIKGKGCPVCESEFIRGSSKKATGRIYPERQFRHDIFRTNSVETYFGTEFRKSKRYQQEATAILEVPYSGHLIYAQMQNHSKDGMYFETEVAIKPGTRVAIKFDRPVYRSASRRYTSIVRWCKGLSDDSGSIQQFGFGVKFL